MKKEKLYSLDNLLKMGCVKFHKKLNFFVKYDPFKNTITEVYQRDYSGKDTYKRIK